VLVTLAKIFFLAGDFDLTLIVILKAQSHGL